jgi:hypothetical protein
MTKTAYVFIFVIIGLALLLHACDEKSDRIVIGQAASIALYDGVTRACQQRNDLRSHITATAISLHPEGDRAELMATLGYEDCETLARKSVLTFQKRLKDKSTTRVLLKKLTELR